MSRAMFQIALAQAMHRDPTDAELELLLGALRDMSMGERVYIPQRQPTDPEVVRRIQDARGNGWSLRRIARTERLSKDTIRRVLSQNPPLFVDTQAA